MLKQLHDEDLPSSLSQLPLGASSFSSPRSLFSSSRGSHGIEGLASSAASLSVKNRGVTGAVAASPGASTCDQVVEEEQQREEEMKEEREAEGEEMARGRSRGGLGQKGEEEGEQKRSGSHMKSIIGYLGGTFSDKRKDKEGGRASSLGGGGGGEASGKEKPKKTAQQVLWGAAFLEKGLFTCGSLQLFGRKLEVNSDRHGTSEDPSSLFSRFFGLLKRRRLKRMREKSRREERKRSGE